MNICHVAKKLLTNYNKCSGKYISFATQCGILDVVRQKDLLMRSEVELGFKSPSVYNTQKEVELW